MSSTLLEQLWLDLRFTLRGLAKAPAFTGTVLGTLVVGITVTTVVFDLTSWVIFRDQPYPHPEQLYYVGYTTGNGENIFYNPGLKFRDYRNQTSSFAEWAAAFNPPDNLVQAGQPLPERIVEVSEPFFSITNIQPVLGRRFRAEEYQPGHTGVLILTDHFWQKYYNRDPGALGQTLLVKGHACTIIGILGAEQSIPNFFTGDVYRPFAFSLDPKQPYYPYIPILARLKSGVTAEQARADLGRVGVPTDLPAWAKTNFARMRPVLTRLSDINLHDTWWMLFTAGAVLYAIACLNAMNLLLIRLLDRRRELSIRFAVGASRFQVVRLVAVEALLLAAGASALVVLLVAVGFRPLFAAIDGNDTADYSSFLTARTLGCVCALSVLGCLVAGAAPVLRLLRADVNSGLKDGGPTLGESRRTGQIRNGFVVLQAAFAVILLTGTGLLMRSFERMSRVDLGFDPTGKVKVWLQVPASIANKASNELELFDRLRASLARLPGVRGVSYGQDALLDGGYGSTADVRMPDGTSRTVNYTVVAADYQQVAGMTLRAGHWFSDWVGVPGGQHSREVVVNESLAKLLFGPRDPIGQFIVLPADPKTPLPIVGVVRDMRSSVSAAALPRYYTSVTLYPRLITTVLLQLDHEPGKTFSDQVRRAIYNVNDQVFMSWVQPVSTAIYQSKWAEHYAARILKGLSAIALGLTIVGIFSVLAYTVDSRRTEFGVRLALGETPAGLHRLVLRRGLGATTVGVALGLAGAAALTRLMQSMLYETSSFDALVYASVALMLHLAAVAACWVPARRAAQADVMRLLKQD